MPGKASLMSKDRHIWDKELNREEGDLARMAVNQGIVALNSDVIGHQQALDATRRLDRVPAGRLTRALRLSGCTCRGRSAASGTAAGRIPSTALVHDATGAGRLQESEVKRLHLTIGAAALESRETVHGHRDGKEPHESNQDRLTEPTHRNPIENDRVSTSCANRKLLYYTVICDPQLQKIESREQEIR